MEDSRIIPKFQVRAAGLVRVPFTKIAIRKKRICV